MSKKKIRIKTTAAEREFNRPALEMRKQHGLDTGGEARECCVSVVPDSYTACKAEAAHQQGGE